jgi:hypothetical protein
MYSEQVNFHPWVGNEYGKASRWGIPLLVVSESYYNDWTDTLPHSYTSDLIKAYGFGEKRHAFFTKLMKAFMGAESDDPGARHSFWNSIAHSVYIQESVGGVSSQRPTGQMWTGAQSPFLEVVSALKPTAIVIVGRAVWDHLPNVIERDSIRSSEGQSLETGQLLGARVGAIHHASYKGFSPTKWHPMLIQFLES